MDWILLFVVLRRSEREVEWRVGIVSVWKLWVFKVEFFYIWKDVYWKFGFYLGEMWIIKLFELLSSNMGMFEIFDCGIFCVVCCVVIIGNGVLGVEY